jgi:hypothetical protein
LTTINHDAKLDMSATPIEGAADMTTTTATETLPAGTVVRYHGSIEHEHWAPWIITSIAEDGRYTLTDRDYPQSVLRQVRRASITPTEETVDMCACGHPADRILSYGLVHEPTVCGVCGWTCTNHVKAEAST